MGSLGAVDQLCEVSVSQQNGWVVLSVKREDIDLYLVKSFKESIEPEMKDAVQMVIDLSGVKFVDSTALAVLVRTHKTVYGLKGSLRLVIATPGISKIFEVCGLYRVFEVFDNLESATAEKAQG